ncbi:MAG TPA: hypothetical protein VMH91_01805 [Candidatus Paceibacterota bacterium]|nr:hypothetical protein [Candidatus Paceibacterota bacterium]
MDSPTQPTFIPHEAVTASARRGGGGLSDLALLISITLIIISGALAAGVFLYSQYLQTSNANKLDQLNRAEASFNPSLIQQLTRLDERMNAAQTLLSTHLAPTQFFAMLEQSTVQDISFTSLSYDATNPTGITLTMSGVAGSVNSIALQAQVFSQSGIITSPIFSNIDAEPGGVHFNFSALIDPSSINYEKLITGAEGAAQPQTQAPQTPAQPTSPFTSSSTPATQ